MKRWRNKKNGEREVRQKKNLFLGMLLVVVTCFAISACGVKDKKVELNLKDGNKDTKEQTDEVQQEESSNSAEENGKAESADSLVEADTRVMEAPTFEYYLADKVANKTESILSLELVSKNANKITDEQEWFDKNKIALRNIPLESITNPSDQTYSKIASSFYQFKITEALQDDKYIYTPYGEDYSEGYYLKIYDKSTKENLYTLDFSSYRYSPENEKEYTDYVQQRITWATIVDNVLYISTSHNTYAEFSNGKTAYITAIDLSDLSILWRSDPLVCNSRDFLVLGDTIICGYGFTAEDDFLYELSKNTGKKVGTIPLASGPSYLIQSGESLFVRTYDTDYEFKIIQ